MRHIFAVYVPADCEGRTMKVAGFFTTSTEAQKFGESGRDNDAAGCYFRIHTIPLYDSAAERLTDKSGGA